MGVLRGFTLLCVLCCVSATTSKNDAKITSLPGLNFQPNFDQYSGYITLEDSTKNIFYWFVESQDNPSEDPVILWLQGGPGCSSLGDGLFLEHGPYYPEPNYSTGTVNLTQNFNSWNQHANVIYAEAPCGVGFSYGTNLPSDYETNDNTTALDNYMFLQGFFDIYSEFASNEFWVTGESYAGVYIPTLAYQILTNGSDTQLANNLKRGGLMLGNPVTNCGGESYKGDGNILNMNNQVNLFYWHGMVSRVDYDEWNSQRCNTESPPNLAACYETYVQIKHQTGHLDQPKQSEKHSNRRIQPNGSLNPDMLYFSYCTGNGTLDFDVSIVPDCFSLDDQVSTYLNNPEVQEAIHAKPTNWRECSVLAYRKLNMDMTNYLEEFFDIAPDMRILYYSGDLDIATVPFAQTQRCLATMNRPVTKNWRPYVINKEVVGYVEEYDTYTFATIKGAGHEAPQFQPAAAYLLFSSFLNNTTLPGAGI